MAPNAVSRVWAPYRARRAGNYLFREGVKGGEGAPLARASAKDRTRRLWQHTLNSWTARVKLYRVTTYVNITLGAIFMARLAIDLS